MIIAAPPHKKHIVYKLRNFSTVATLPRSAKMTARAHSRMLNEVKKNPRVSAKDYRNLWKMLTSLLTSLR